MSCIAGGIGGGILGVFGTQAYMTGGLGIFAPPTFISPKEGITAGFWGAIIAIVVSLIVGFVLTYLFGFTKRKILQNQLKQLIKLSHQTMMKQF